MFISRNMKICMLIIVLISILNMKTTFGRGGDGGHGGGGYGGRGGNPGMSGGPGSSGPLRRDFTQDHEFNGGNYGKPGLPGW